MPGFNCTKWFIIFTTIVMLMNSCVSNQKTNRTSKTTTFKKTEKQKKEEERKKEEDEKRRREDVLKKRREDVKTHGVIPSDPLNSTYLNIDSLDEYIVGPRDILKIIQWKSNGPYEKEMKIREDGRISYSFLDDLYVNKLTPTQIDKLITKKLEGFVKNPRVDVIVEKFASKKASLFGEIETKRQGKGPDVWPIRGKVRLLDFLLEAGGPTDKADLKRVELTRGGKMYIIDLLAAFARDDENENVVVEAHDRYLIPKLPQYKKKAEADNEVYVFGAVNGPGVYSFAGKSHVVDAIARAGGLKLESGMRNIHIIRGTEEGTEVINVDFNKLFKHHDLSQRVTILDDDIVYVSKTKIDKTKELLAKVQPILSFLMGNPMTFRENYTTGGGLRLDTDISERSKREEDGLGGFAGAAAQ